MSQRTDKPCTKCGGKVYRLTYIADPDRSFLECRRCGYQTGEQET